MSALLEGPATPTSSDSSPTGTGAVVAPEVVASDVAPDANNGVSIALTAGAELPAS
jgi:hypothetical protein